MGNPSILLAGLRLKKSLQENAPEEYKVLGPAIEKFCEHASPQQAPPRAIITTLSDAFASRQIAGSVEDKEALNFALYVFAGAIEAIDPGRNELYALRCTISLYRSRLDQCS